MKKIIRIKESILRKIIQEQVELGEYGVKGMKRGELWTEEEQMLAFFNAKYGIRELGYTEEEVSDILGFEDRNSFAKQTANFKKYLGLPALNRPNKMQDYVFEKYDDIPRFKFQKLCLDYIKERIENPTERDSKRKLGRDIGRFRDEITLGRETELNKHGKSLNNMTLISSKPKFEPSPDAYDDEPEIQTTTTSPTVTKKTAKDEVRDYLKSLYDKVIENDPKLADDIQLISNFIDDELVNKEMVSEIRKLFKPTIINENKTNKIKKVIRIKESDIKKIVGRILKEQEDMEEMDYHSFHNDENLSILRRALDNNKTVSVAFVKKDGTVRHMAIRKNLSSYVPSDREKTEKQQNVEMNNDIKRVVDINSYIRTLKETGDKELAAKGAWRSINLKNVLGFMASGQFIDVREENEIIQRFGEEINNSLTKSMVKAMEQQVQNIEAEENVENPINENKKKKVIRIKESELKKSLRN